MIYLEIEVIWFISVDDVYHQPVAHDSGCDMCLNLDISGGRHNDCFKVRKEKAAQTHEEGW